MKNRKNVLWLVGVLLLGMVSAGYATEALTPLQPGEFVFENGDGASTWKVKLDVDGNKLPTNFSFYLITTTGNYERLLSSTSSRSGGSFDIYASDVNGEINYIADNGVWELNLGTTSSFGFRFNFPSIASTIKVTPTDEGFTLADLGGSGGVVGISTNASAVPIPGSALLLGSGVIGLLGIGSRRKKDNA